MQSICIRHYRYKSRQYYRGSNLGTESGVADSAQSVFVVEEHDNWKAPLSSIQTESVQLESVQLDAIHSKATQLVQHDTVGHTAVSHAAVASASVDYPVEFREEAGRTASYPAWH